MPTYTYRCTECRKKFDLFHSISDDSPKACPKCGAIAQRQIGAGNGLIFKGSGFYITDYKKSNSSAGVNGNGKAPKDSKGSEGTTSSSPSKETKAPKDSGKTGDAS